MSKEMYHASAVAMHGRGVLITGQSGSGKSSLSLQLMSLGAVLISDDQTLLSLRDGKVWAESPPTISGLIEARGIGILQVEHADASLALVVDLDQTEAERLPKACHVTILNRRLPCFHKVNSEAWPAAILQYLKGSRRDPE